MIVKQKTLANDVRISGKGLHTGVDVEMTLKPAPKNTGYKFVRVDLEKNPEIPADASLVVDTSRGTVLEKNGARVATVEHTLAALRGKDLDNVIIELNASEAPIMDGSSKPIMEAIGNENIVEQDAEREYFEIREKFVFENPETGVKLVALPDDQFSVDVMISFNSSVLNNQYATLDSMDGFEKEIAPCRTFVFLHELEFLLNNNLVKGGDLDNAIVIIDREIPQDEMNRIADLFQHEHIEVRPQGILSNLELQFENEPARHKLLDVVGDLALVGRPIKGKIIASKPGHQANTQFAKILQKEMKKQFSKSTAPVYDMNKPAILDVQEIKKLLPHRYPFLLVDKVIELKPTSIVAVKNVTFNEPHFTGHFPVEPVMPGVLQVEAMAQVGGVLVLSHLGEGDYSTYFLKIDGIKFRKKVVPGDTMIIKVEQLTPIRRGIATMKGYVFTGSGLASECEFTAQIIKNE